MIILNHFIRWTSRLGDSQSINNRRIKIPKIPNTSQDILKEKISEVFNIISRVCANDVKPIHSDSSERYSKKAEGDIRYSIPSVIIVGIKNNITYNILAFQVFIVVRKKGKTTIGKIFSAKAIPNDIPERFNLFLNKK